MGYFLLCFWKIWWGLGVKLCDPLRHCYKTILMDLFTNQMIINIARAICVNIQIQQYDFVGLFQKHRSEHLGKYITTDDSGGIFRSEKHILFHYLTNVLYQTDFQQERKDYYDWHILEARSFDVGMFWNEFVRPHFRGTLNSVVWTNILVHLFTLFIAKTTNATVEKCYKRYYG